MRRRTPVSSHDWRRWHWGREADFWSVLSVVDINHRYDYWLARDDHRHYYPAELKIIGLLVCEKIHSAKILAFFLALIETSFDAYVRKAASDKTWTHLWYTEQSFLNANCDWFSIKAVNTNRRHTSDIFRFFSWALQGSKVTWARLRYFTAHLGFQALPDFPQLWNTPP